MFQWLQRLLGRIYRPLHPLVQGARSPLSDKRLDAAIQLGKVPESWAVEELIRLLSDMSTPVRAAARASLSNLGAVAIPGLKQGLSHANPEIAVASAELLGNHPTREVVDQLLLTLKFGPRPVQLAARRSLGRCGAIAIPALQAGLSESQPWVREQINSALREAEGTAAGNAPSEATARSQEATKPSAQP